MTGIADMNFLHFSFPFVGSSMAVFLLLTAIMGLTANEVSFQPENDFINSPIVLEQDKKIEQ